ncbi:MAG: PIG-L family deacetylase [bacterium]|nr:PIG-L family deacetylase [bacterium]
MKLSQPGADVYAFDGCAESEALSRVTHLAIGAHQDDLEFMAWYPIKLCFHRNDKWFGGVTATNGSGSARCGLYGETTDEEMVRVRRLEQKKAAFIGEYGVQVQLDFSSKDVKRHTQAVIDDLIAVFKAARPRVVYTHNFADKHDSHVGVALRVVEALRSLPQNERPERLVGCEVWRDLDWQNDDDKVVMNLDGHENLADALMGVYDSQIVGGKRYDRATRGRRRAHATYFASHEVDESQSLSFGMDMTMLLKDETLDPLELVQRLIGNFAEEVSGRIDRVR